MYMRSLTEKTDELKKCREEFELKQTELKSQVEKLKKDNKRCVHMYIVIFTCIHAYMCIIYIILCIINVHMQYSKF